MRWLSQSWHASGGRQTEDKQINTLYVRQWKVLARRGYRLMEGAILNRKTREGVPDKVVFMQRHEWHKDYVFMWGKSSTSITFYYVVLFCKYGKVLTFVNSAGLTVVFWMFENFHNKTRRFFKRKPTGINSWKIQWKDMRDVLISSKWNILSLWLQILFP